MQGTAVGRHALIRTLVRPTAIAAAVLAVATLVVAGVSLGTSALPGSSPTRQEPAAPYVLTAGERLSQVHAQTRYTELTDARVAAEAARHAAEQAARKAAEEQARKEAEAKAAAEAAAKAEAERQAAAERAARAAERAAADPRSVARAMLSDYGWGEDQFSCLDQLWTRESNWNHRAQNPSSGAYGIPQALLGGKMASAGSDWQTNPATQIEWGLGYIRDVYGSPCGAWGHSQSAGWY